MGRLCFYCGRVNRRVHAFSAKCGNRREKLRTRPSRIPAFKKDLAPVNLPEKTMNSTVLFELFRCGVRSINEAGYCNKIGEDFFKQLSDEQKTVIRPIFNKYFSNRPVR